MYDDTPFTVGKREITSLLSEVRARQGEVTSLFVSAVAGGVAGVYFTPGALIRHNKHSEFRRMRFGAAFGLALIVRPRLAVQHSGARLTAPEAVGAQRHWLRKLRHALLLGPYLVHLATLSVRLASPVHMEVPVACRAGGLMPKSMVAVLAAVGATMFALVPFAHGILILLVIAVGAVVTGLAAFGALCPVSVPENKKKLSMPVSRPVATDLRVLIRQL